MNAVVDFLFHHGGDGALLVLVGLLPLLLFLLCYSALATPAPAPWSTATLFAGRSWLDGAGRAIASGPLIRRSVHRGRALFHALDLLLLCAAAGLPLDGALIMADEALRPFDPALAKLLATAAHAVDGMDAIDALEDLAAGVGDAQAKRLILALAAGARPGVPYAETVGGLMDDMRREEALAIEERAARLPAEAAMPIIKWIIPAALILVIGPPILHWLIGLFS
jgi:hypothetical protein